jgi:hypothetical protein
LYLLFAKNEKAASPTGIKIGLINKSKEPNRILVGVESAAPGDIDAIRTIKNK